MCFILFLSKDVVPSSFIEEEVRVAIEEGLSVMFLHHPSTDHEGYWKFADYIEAVPET